jgi:hypothetical protein
VTPRPDARPFAELLIDCWEDRTLRPLLVGMLREIAESLALKDRFLRCREWVKTESRNKEDARLGTPQVGVFR